MNNTARLPDFNGRLFTLPQAAAHYETRGAGPLLLLEPGPGAASLPAVKEQLAAKAPVFYARSPKIEGLLQQSGVAENFALPAGCRKIGAASAGALAASCRICFYKPALRLDPEFWGPFLGALDARDMENGQNAQASSPPPGRQVWLPGDSSLLLRREVAQALEELGLEPATAGPLPGQKLALSINLQGLDADGRVFHTCRALDIPVAIWLVDNPWHLLSAVRLPWWRKAHLFVTDPSHIADLKALDAQNVHFLPLAAAGHMFAAGHKTPGPPVFVGRSEFPDRAAFFAAARYPRELRQKARESFAAGLPPDFHWWKSRLPGPLWPGFACRNIGLAAEDCARHNRGRWLRAAGDIQIYGDAAWKELAPRAALRAPVDYYGELPQIYAAAAAVLNVTSLLLPHSLNQRHFDVWAAGGLLLSDATKGLDIFPEELVEPMRLRLPEEFGERLAWFGAQPARRAELIAAWRALIQKEHLYRHRIARLLEVVGC